MRQYNIISKYLIISVVAVLIVLGLSWTSRDSVAQPNDAIGDDVLTVEQCVNDNTNASIKPAEKKILIKEGIIEEQLSNRKVTKEECRKIMTLTPNGSPVERIIAAGNVIQEIDAVQNSMKEAVEGDVNGDGVVDVQDTRVASAASYAASHTAQKTIRTAIDEEAAQTGVIEEINAVPAAYLQDTTQDQYGGDGSDGNGGGGGGGGGDDFFERLPSQEEVQATAVSAAQDKGASPKAAVSGGNCAARVQLAAGTYLDIAKGDIAFETPAKEMVVNERDIIELLMRPSALDSIEALKQRLKEAEQPSEIHSQCIRLAEKMQAKLISGESAFSITQFGSDVQDIVLSEDTGWKWEIVASNPGTHRLMLYIEMRSAQGEKIHAMPAAPFDDDIIVRATLWQKSTGFVGGHWQFFLAPFLAPIAFYLWRKHKKRSNEHDDDEHERGYI